MRISSGVILCIYVSIASGQTFHDQVSSDAIWDRLFENGDIPEFENNKARRYADEINDDDFLLSDEDDVNMPIYPELSRKAAQFAVNPSFDSYYNPNLKRAEILIRTKEEAETPQNDEVAEDPFEPETRKTTNPKKAIQDPLIGRPEPLTQKEAELNRINDIYFITLVSVGTAMSVFAIVGAGFCYHRVRRNSRAGEEVEYPAYGVTGPGKEISPTSGDRKLAQSAQMYHYQHQKQQMIAFDRNNQDQRANGNGNAHSDVESEDGEEGDYTVYECPGLAPTGEMEVRNPLFQDEPTPKAP